MPSDKEHPAKPGGPNGPGGPAENARKQAAAERLIYSHVQHLHDEGVIDLDAPARNLIEALDRNYPEPTDEALAARADLAQAGGYWLAGDQGWCNHLT